MIAIVMMAGLFTWENIEFFNTSRQQMSEGYKWEYVGKFMSKDLDNVVKGEDISCPNFFKLRNKWVLLCISHSHGCRYYIGDWDKKREQFFPEFHERMNWSDVKDPIEY